MKFVSSSAIILFMAIIRSITLAKKSRLLPNPCHWKKSKSWLGVTGLGILCTSFRPAWRTRDKSAAQRPKASYFAAWLTLPVSPTNGITGAWIWLLVFKWILDPALLIRISQLDASLQLVVTSSHWLLRQTTMIQYQAFEVDSPCHLTIPKLVLDRNLEIGIRVSGVSEKLPDSLVFFLFRTGVYLNEKSSINNSLFECSVKSVIPLIFRGCYF